MILFFFILSAALYGSTMKIADLLDEHGLKLFRGDAIVFGVLWGMTGGAIIFLKDNEISNIILAMNIAFIFRMRIDYKNHAIAVCIIIISFLLKGVLLKSLFFIFLGNFILFGSFKDFLGDYTKEKSWPLFFFQSGWFYIIPTFFYSFYSSNWLVFLVLSVYSIFYNIVKYWHLLWLK